MDFEFEVMADDMLTNEEIDKAIFAEGIATGVHRLAYFCFNFPYDWVSECFGNNRHLQDKWESLCLHYDTALAVLRFYLELDTTNQVLFEKYIETKYKNKK